MVKLLTVMPQKKFKTEDLKIGTLIRDVQTGDLALLVQRVNLFDSTDNKDSLWIWELIWTGPATDYYNRNTPFMEESIIGLLNSSVWEIISVDES